MSPYLTLKSSESSCASCGMYANRSTKDAQQIIIALPCFNRLDGSKGLRCSLHECCREFGMGEQKEEGGR